MKKLLLIISVLFSIQSFGQIEAAPPSATQDDTTFYIKHPYTYGLKENRVYPTKVLRTPKDTIYSKAGLAIIDTTLWYGDELVWRRSGDATSGAAGTVTSVSVVTANGFQGTVANATTTPAITLETSVTTNRVLYANANDIAGSANFTFNGDLVSILAAGQGVTQSDNNGLLLYNSTAAANGAQQISPSIHWSGRGWKTDATAASQSVDFRAYILPVQGAANPSATWKLQKSINGGAYADVISFGSSGELFTGAGSAGSANQALLSGGAGAAFTWGTVDLSATNEIQTISAGGSTSPTIDLSLTGGTVTFSPAGIVTFSRSGNTITVTGTEVDGSTTNEIQTFASSSDATSHTLTLSGPNGTLQFVEGSGITMATTGTGLDGILTLTAVDASATNELQTIAVTGTTTGITTLSNSGGSMTIAGAGINTVGVSGSTITITGTEVDGSTTNELQTIANTSDATSHTVTLSNSGGSVQFIEGSNITLTTGGSGSAGTVTIAATGLVDITATDDNGFDFTITGTTTKDIELTTTLTQGSVFFAGSGGAINEDNDNLFYDNPNDWFGVGTNTPEVRLHVISDEVEAYAAIIYGDGHGLSVDGANTIFIASTSGTPKFEVDSDGSIAFDNSTGTSGQILKSNGAAAAPTWVDPSTVFSGTVSTVSVVTDNGFQGSVANATTTPAITLETSVTTNRVLYANSNELTGSANFTFDGSLTTHLSAGLGVTQDDAKGLLLTNTTAAAAGAQQISPSVHWSGRGWKTDATAASRAVDFRAFVLPVQGAANPSGIFKIQSSINGGAYADKISFGSLGEIFDGSGSAGTAGYALTSGGAGAAWSWSEVDTDPDNELQDFYGEDLSGEYQVSLTPSGSASFIKFIAGTGVSFVIDDTDHDQSTLTISAAEVQALSASGTTSPVINLTGGSAITFDAGTGISLSRSSNTITIASSVTTASGTYTPTLSGAENVSSSTAYLCQYLRVGNTVTVSGKVDLTTSSSGTTRLGISLPIASTLGNDFEVGGAGHDSNVSAAAIRADAGNDRAELIFTAGEGLSATYHFSFTYLILNN